MLPVATRPRVWGMGGGRRGRGRVVVWREVLVRYSRVNPMVKDVLRITRLFVGAAGRGVRGLAPRRVCRGLYHVGVLGRPGLICRAWQGLGRDTCLTGPFWCAVRDVTCKSAAAFPLHQGLQRERHNDNQQCSTKAGSQSNGYPVIAYITNRQNNMRCCNVYYKRQLQRYDYDIAIRKIGGLSKRKKKKKDFGGA